MARKGYLTIYKSTNIRIKIGWVEYPGIEVTKNNELTNLQGRAPGKVQPRNDISPTALAQSASSKDLSILPTTRPTLELSSSILDPGTSILNIGRHWFDIFDEIHSEHRKIDREPLIHMAAKRNGYTRVGPRIRDEIEQAYERYLVKTK
jgi:hypothetical protein